MYILKYVPYNCVYIYIYICIYIYIHMIYIYIYIWYIYVYIYIYMIYIYIWYIIIYLFPFSYQQQLIIGIIGKFHRFIFVKLAWEMEITSDISTVFFGSWPTRETVGKIWWNQEIHGDIIGIYGETNGKTKLKENDGKPLEHMEVS